MEHRRREREEEKTILKKEMEQRSAENAELHRHN